MLKLCFDLAHSMFNDGYSPSTRHGEETFGHRADDTSFCFVVYPGVIFCECGQVELFLRLPSFPAVGALPVVFTPATAPRPPTAECLTRPLPSSGRLAAAAGLSPFLTSRPLARLASAAARRPQPCLSPQPGAPPWQ